MNIRFTIFLFLLIIPFLLQSQSLTNNTDISVSKTWSQEPEGWTYPLDIMVPTVNPPTNGFPVCILLHGNGGRGQGMVAQYRNILDCHILVAPTGYENSWNISNEKSEAPDLEMVSDLISQLKSYDNIDSTKFRIIGSSNGAALTNRLFIENPDPNIDIFCSIISQLSEASYHNGKFYAPSGATGGDDQYDGYDVEKTPIMGRKYLNICNENDPLIPYTGGEGVGVNFLDAQLAAFIVAKSQGYTGEQLTGTGTQVDTNNLYEYKYLSGQVVHLKGDARHGSNPQQLEYVKGFFAVDCFTSDIEEAIVSDINVYPNPAHSFLNIDLEMREPVNYQLYSLLGKQLLRGTINNYSKKIDISQLPPNVYLLTIGNHSFKILKIE